MSELLRPFVDKRRVMKHAEHKQPQNGIIDKRIEREHIVVWRDLDAHAKFCVVYQYWNDRGRPDGFVLIQFVEEECAASFYKDAIYSELQRFTADPRNMHAMICQRMKAVADGCGVIAICGEIAVRQRCAAKEYVEIAVWIEERYRVLQVSGGPTTDGVTRCTEPETKRAQEDKAIDRNLPIGAMFEHPDLGALQVVPYRWSSGCNSCEFNMMTCDTALRDGRRPECRAANRADGRATQFRGI